LKSAFRSGAPERRTPGSADPTHGLWAGLVVLLLVRALLAWIPAPALWGFHQQRFVPPAMAWLPWLLAAIVLLPPVGRAALSAFEGLVRALSRVPGLPAAVLAAAAAALVWALPDRLYYVGDFLLRRGAVRAEENPAVLSPQAFPLDVLLHYTIPVRAIAAGWLDASRAGRAIGALDAAGLALAALLLARAAGAWAGARLAAFAVAFFGGYLCLMTGESKAFAEMVVVVIGFSGFALMALRPATGHRPDSATEARAGRMLLGAALCLSVGLFLHRLSLGLLLPFALLVVARVRAAGVAGLRSAPALLALAAPLACLAALGPRLMRTALGYDVSANFATSEVGGAGGFLGAALAPMHLLDIVNQIAFLSPLALAALPLLFLRPRDADAAGAGWGPPLFLASMAVPYGLVLLFLQPPQGPLRDWEAYAPPAAALSVAAAWGIARALDRSRRAWLAVAVAFGVAAPTVQWLAHFSDQPRGLARLEALMSGPPLRSSVDRATTWNFIGWRHFRAKDYDRAARAFEQASEAAPSPRLLTDWAMAETMLGRPERAFEIYSRAVARDSNYRLGWVGVGVSALNSGRPADAVPAVRALERLDPRNPKTIELSEWVRKWELEGRP